MRSTRTPVLLVICLLFAMATAALQAQQDHYRDNATRFFVDGEEVCVPGTCHQYTLNCCEEPVELESPPEEP